MSIGSLLPWLLAVAAAAAAVYAFKSLGALKSASTDVAERLAQEGNRHAEEKARLEFELSEWREKAVRFEKRVAEVEESLAEATGELEHLRDRSKREQTSQRQFFGRKAREAYEVLKQRLASDGFPERLEALANGSGPKAISEESKRILKEMESWMEQGGVEDPNILHSLALVDFSRGDAKHAEMRLRTAARVATDPLVHENLGDLMRLTSRPKRAVESYKKAAKAAPETAPVHRKLGLALFETGDFAAAVKPLTFALAARPTDPDLHLKTARALLESGDFQKAVDVTQDASKRFPKNPLFPATAIVAFGRMKKYRDAQKSFEKAIEIDPQNPDAHIARGLELLDEAKTVEARAAFETALGCDPARPEPHYGLGVTSARVQDHEVALSHLKKAVEIKPDYAEAWYAMKSSYEALKKFEAAVEALNRAVSLNPHLTA